MLLGRSYERKRTSGSCRAPERVLQGAVEKWTSGQVDKWTSGQVDKWTSGQVDKWKERFKEIYIIY